MTQVPTEEVKQVPTVDHQTNDTAIEADHLNVLGDIQKGKLDVSTEMEGPIHVEMSAVDDVYLRKVYIMNKIINEHIGMT